MRPIGIKRVGGEAGSMAMVGGMAGTTVNRLCASCQRGCKQDSCCVVVACPRYVAAPRQEVLPMRVGRARVAPKGAI